jgi:hypothetical protein
VRKGMPVNEIEITGPDGDELAVWMDDELRLSLAAGDLLEALEVALERLEISNLRRRGRRIHRPGQNGDRQGETAGRLTCVNPVGMSQRGLLPCNAPGSNDRSPVAFPHRCERGRRSREVNAEKLITLEWQARKKAEC